MAVKFRSHFAVVLGLTAALTTLVAPQHAGAQGACATVGICTSGSTLDEFRHKPSGVHFYTACVEEKTTLTGLPDVFEATGRAIPYSPATGSLTTPLTRFFLSGGTLAANRHFYTAITPEVGNLGLNGFNWGFQICSEGERGRAFEPQGLVTSAAPPPIDPRLILVAATNAYCGRSQMPVWRVLQANPVQHRLSHRFEDYLADLSAPSADDEGIRLCFAAPWATVQTQTAAPSAALSDATDREVTISVTTPDSATAVQLGIALPPNVEVTGYADLLSTGCTASGTAAIGRLVQCNLAASASLTRTGKLLVRAGSGYNSALPGSVRTYAVASTAPSGIAANARACTGTDRPIYGCSTANLPTGTPAATGLPAFTVGSVTLSGPAATTGGGTGTLQVPITTANAADAGRTIRVYGESSAVASGLFSAAGQVDATLPANGSTVNVLVPIASGSNPADLRACVTTPELASGFGAYEAGCNNPANNRKSPILNAASFGTPPAASLAVGVYSLPVGTVGLNYVGSYYCTGPAGLTCTADGLPIGLSASCGPLFGSIMDCVITGTPTSAEVRNVILRASAPGLSPVTRSEVIQIQAGTPPPASITVNLGPPSVTVLAAGATNAIRVTVQAQSDPAGGMNLLVYLKDSVSGSWTQVGGQNGANLSISPQTFTFDLTTPSSTFQIRVCATNSGRPILDCGNEASDRPSGNPAYTTSSTINVGPPPALVNATWAAQPTALAVGAVGAYAVAVRSADASNLATGPLYAHIQLPTNWSLDTASSPGCTQTGQRATCPILLSGPLSATTPVSVSFGLRANARSGGIAGTPALTVNSGATPPAAILCSPPTASCINGGAVTPTFYDLLPQTTGTTPPPIGGTSIVRCVRDGSEPPPADAGCRLQVTYTDSTTSTSLTVPYSMAATPTAELLVCAADAPGDASCALRLVADKTAQIFRLTALDGTSALDNNPDNNARNIYDVTPPPPPTINVSGLVPGTQAAPYNGSFFCEGTLAVENLTCDVGALPAGLTRGTCSTTTTASLRRITCPVTGTPSAQGTFTVTITATTTNTTPSTVSANASLTVGAPITGCTPVTGAQRLEAVRPGDERLRQRINLANGTYYIELTPHPDWRKGPNQVPDSSYFRFEGGHPSQMDRVISVSKCPGDVTSDDETLEVISGEAAAFGTYLYFYGLPASSPAVRAGPPGPRTSGLPGLLGGTTWYLNIRQTRCEEPVGVPAPTCGMIYDVIP